MTNPSLAVAVAICFLWLGMVLAISFLEAPLKFRAEGLDLRVGLAIGRLVFRALNLVEVLLLVALLLTVGFGRSSTVTVAVALVAALILGLQLAGVRPRLTRRSNRVLAGEDVPRSRTHHVYIALEAAKVAVLIMLGVLLLSP